MKKHVGVYYRGQVLSGPPDYLILLEQAVELVRQKKAQFVKHKKAILDLTTCAPRTHQVVDENVPTSGATDTSISPMETLVNALGDMEPKQHEVRRVRDKIRAWPFVGDTKAIRVGPAVEFA